MSPLRFLGLALVLSASPLLAQSPGQMFLENWDSDGDGAVTFEEARQKREDIFFTFDADEDGRLDAEEYTTFDDARAYDMEQMGAQGGKGHGPAQGMRREVTDLDGDGIVTRAEFLDTLPAWFDRLDRNGDDVVNEDDFQR